MPKKYDIEQIINELCEGMNVELLRSWKHFGNENAKKVSVNPNSRIIVSFNQIIDSHIQAKQNILAPQLSGSK